MRLSSMIVAAAIMQSPVPGDAQTFEHLQARAWNDVARQQIPGQATAQAPARVTAQVPGPAPVPDLANSAALTPTEVAVLTLTQGSAQTSNTRLDALSRREKLFGWEGVGRIDIGRTGFCTGTLVATDLVLTAAHCLFDPQGRAHDPGSMVFKAGLSDGIAIAERKVARALAHSGYDPTGGTGAGNIRHDAALLQLAEPIPAATAAPFVVQAAVNLNEVSVLSYARGRANALSWQRACGLLGTQSGLIAFDCDVHFGSSGAPVFDRSGNRARIVSIISAGRRGSDGTVSFGMPLPRLVDEMKAALRAGRGVINATGATLPGPAPVIRRPGAAGYGRDIGARFVRP